MLAELRTGIDEKIKLKCRIEVKDLGYVSMVWGKDLESCDAVWGWIIN